MNILSDYHRYISMIEQGDSQCVFEGELSVLSICNAENGILNSTFFVLDTLNDEGRTVLMKVAYDGKSLRIIEGRYITSPLIDIAQCTSINDMDQAIKWWNLCYYNDGEGNIKYDPYYDTFYAANETELKMSDLHKVIELWIEDMFVDVEGIIYVLGDLAGCNPVLYQLQRKGIEVKTLSIDNSESTIVSNDDLLKLREQFIIPYCNVDMVNVNFLTSQGINNWKAKCHHTYLISIPIDLIDINDKAIGDYTYKSIIYSGEFNKDYTCCGHEYCYMEMEFFADLHGNTVLKTTNSKAESKYTIINKLNYTNVQVDGQSN